MDYCIQVWRVASLLEKDISLLESIQRRFTKKINTCRNMEYAKRLVHLGLMTVEDRMRRADLIEMYRILHKIDDLEFDSFFDRNYSITRGHDFKLFKQRRCRNVGVFSFSSRMIDCWNNLPNSVVNAQNLKEFKCGLQKVFNRSLDSS